jgi:phospholipase/carboxylesterase
MTDPAPPSPERSPEAPLVLTGLRALGVGSLAGAELAVIILHGMAMEPEDLAPFGHSLGLPAWILFPEGPLSATPRGRAWWDVDAELRSAALARGPRDLAGEHPSGRPAARARLAALLVEVSRLTGGLPLILIGFSQGGMLACDTLLHAADDGWPLPPVACLMLLSSSRIAFDEWSPRLDRLRGLPALVSHGRSDADLAFSAGEALRDALVTGGAQVTWVPFDGAHEIPLVVWRQIRKRSLEVLDRGRAPAAK